MISPIRTEINEGESIICSEIERFKSYRFLIQRREKDIYKNKQQVNIQINNIHFLKKKL